MAVSDDSGLVLVGVGKRNEQDLLALWGALDAHQRERYQHEVNVLCDDGNCTVSHFELDGECYSVTEITPGAVSPRPIAGDLCRILGTPRATESDMISAI